MRTLVGADFQVVALPVRVDASSVTELRRDLQQALANGAGDLVVDLSAVGVLDAAGLGMLVATHRRAGNAGRRMVLRAVPSGVARVLALTRLNRVLNIERAPASASSGGMAASPA
jgi:anti-sigma B factor antagonist